MRKTAIAVVMLLAVTGGAAAITIDIPPPPFNNSPWHSLSNEPVITFAFKTSWDDILWTDEQKTAAYDALGYLDSFLPDQTFEESADFTIRWAGADFFKNYRNERQDWQGTPRNYDVPGWDMTNFLAVAYKHDNGPWDPAKYPNNEIYFNTKYSWSYSLTNVDPNKYDFWSVLQHESIHMLACDNHAKHQDEVMYESIGLGQRKYIQTTDLEILVGAGYKVIPEPVTLAGLTLGIGGLAAYVRRRRAA